MKFLAVLATIILIAGFIGTLSLTGKGDDDYSSSTKRNVINLTLMYVGLVVALTFGIGLYIAL